MYFELCTVDQTKRIYDEFNITEESLKRDVAYLIEWMEKQPHLPNVKDEVIISNFLIHCKNSLEKAKTKLDAYYSARSLVPEIFSNRSPSSISFKNSYDAASCIPLPKVTPEGDRIFIFEIFDQDKAKLLTADVHLLVTCAIYDITLKFNGFSRKNILIYKVTDSLTVKLATTFLQALIKIFPVSQKLYQFRIEKIYVVIETNPAYMMMLNTMKAMFKPKMGDRFVIWNDKKADFSSIYPPEILPQEYGGKGKSSKELHKQFYDYLCEFEDWIQSEEDMKADLSKCTNSSVGTTSWNEMDGSFRQLIID